MSNHFQILTRSNFSNLRARVGITAMIFVFVISLLGMNHGVASAAGNTYYVNNTVACSESGPGSMAQPFCTISKGANVAVAGDTVKVVAGTYPETVIINGKNGTGANPITFQGSEGVTITGANPGFGSAFALTSASYIVIDGFKITNTPYKGIYVDSSNHITISNNEVSNAGVTSATHPYEQGIYLKNTTYSTITGNTTHHNTCIGIRLVSNSDYNVISDNVSYANFSVVETDAAGIELTGASHNTIINNITYSNEDSGINIYVHPSGIQSTYNLIIGNLSYENGDHGIDHNNSPYNTVIGNTVQGNGTVGINFEGEVNTGSHHAIVMNNIMAGNGFTPPSGSFGGNLRLDTPSIANSVIDYNLYNIEDASVQIIWNNTNYNSLAAFRVAEPTQEVHGLEGDPLFVDPVPSVLRVQGVPYEGTATVGDYHLTGGSPAIDSANSGAPNQLATDLDGHARVDDPATANTGAGSRAYDDRGAYEFVPSGSDVLPTVTTQAVTGITQVTATANGNITNLGVPNPTQHGVVWSTTANPTTANSKTTNGAVSATGAFTASLTGLTPGTLYHVRAYATNAAGTAYGEDVTFTTLAATGNTGFVFANQTVASNSVTNANYGWTLNNQYAIFNSSSDTADYGFPDLAIPAEATIDGIEVTIEGQREGSFASRDLTAALWKTSAYTTSKTASLASDDVTRTLGSPTDKWGTTWTPADFGDATFKIRVGATNAYADAWLDAIAVKVYYTLPIPQATTTTVSCGAGTAVVSYKSSITCVATVVRASGSNTPAGNITWTTNVSGTFATSPCTLSGAAGTSTCSVTYTPNAVGTGSHLISAAYAGNAYFLASSGSQAVTVNPLAASVTPNAATKAYGAADPAFTGTLVGFLPADNVTATYSRAVGETVLGGPYAISATLSPAGLLANYTITYNTANFTITPIASSVTSNAASKIYGSNDPAFTGTLVGFLPADNVTATYSRTTGETVLGGPYEISATLSPANVLSNYTITYNKANFTITPKAASVTPDALNKVYGSDDPVLTGTLTGFIAADKVTATYSRVAGETVLSGPYAISATLSPVEALSNYTVTYNTADFTITAKAASVTPHVASKVYGSTDPVFTGTLTGFLDADNVTATYSRVAGETVSGGPYTISAVLNPTAALSNYTVTYKTADFAITPKALTISGVTANNKVYDGNTTASLSGTATLAGIVTGDTVTLGGTPTATFETKDVGHNKPVTVAGYTISGVSVSNYTLTQPTALKADITVASLTVTGVTANNKVYNANTNATLKTGNAALVGVIDGDSVNITKAGVAGTFADKNVGLDKLVTTSGFAITGNDAQNYVLTQPTATADITAKDLVVSAAGIDKVYDATTAATVNLSTDALSGDIVAAAYTSASFADKNVGANKAVSVSGISIHGADAGNYNLLNTTANITAEITPLDITVTAHAKTKFIGTNDPALTYSVTPALFSGDTFTGALTRVAGEAAGQYAIEQGTLFAGENYTIHFTGANLTIVPTTTANMSVYLAGGLQKEYAIEPSVSTRDSFAGVSAGPVKLVSTNYVPIMAAERVVYKVDGVNTSYSEMMGLPSNQLDTTYWLPWYNNKDLDTQIRFANTTNTPTTVHIYIGGQEMGTGFALGANESTRQSFPGVSNGPVKIVSDVPIVAAERVVYKVNGVNTSFTEMMALPNSQLSTTYWLPWYNNKDLDTQIRFANTTNTPTTVHIYIGGQEMGTGFALGANESTRQSFPGVSNGPVKIVSEVPIVVAERVVYKVDGVNTSFSEMMGLPSNQLDTTYWLPWYNSKDFDTQIRFANTTSTPTTVHIYIGGQEMGTGFTLGANESTRQSFPGISNGPVKIVSDVPIVVAERLVYKVNNVATSYSEMMGLPKDQLDTTYWLPWYNNKDLDTQLRFGVP